jgi:hypothetical protein
VRAPALLHSNQGSEEKEVKKKILLLHTDFLCWTPVLEFQMVTCRVLGQELQQITDLSLYPFQLCCSLLSYRRVW